MYIHVSTVGSVKEGSQRKVQYPLNHGQCIVADVYVCVWQCTYIARRVMQMKCFLLAHTI